MKPADKQKKVIPTPTKPKSGTTTSTGSVRFGAFIWNVYLVVGINLFSLVLFAALVLAVAFLNGEKWELLFIFFFAFGVYSLMFYQMKEDGTLFSSGGWMQSGYKRGLFCYALLALFIVATSKWVAWAFAKLDEQMVLFKKPSA